MASMNTPPTSPSLAFGTQASDGGVPCSSTQCLARDLRRWGNECPKSPCSARGDSDVDERLLCSLAGRGLDLIADAKAHLGTLPVGRGPYCYVYEVLNTGKVIKFPRSKRHSKMVLLEAAVQYTIALQCRHVTPVLAVSYVSKQQFTGLRASECVPGIVMPRMRMDLQRFYQAHDHVEVRRIWWKAAEQTLSCLQSLKTQAFIHGDIKTANILLDFEQEPNFFLADFSTAKKVPRGSRAIRGASIQATMEYCAPETLRDSIESFDTDLYSLGLCLLALITRQEPFRELQQAKNHGTYSVQQSQWLVNAVLKNDPINLNVLSKSLHCQWPDELSFLSLILVKRLPVEDCIVAISRFHR
ncbi:hypothetical protein HG536_0B01630 [Torulaspora globosa]|uniref:Protein kinase domain-containing protein n=1 Tax=Torulaspora globosa TaxID=48254 RepID=A0A7G3ZCR4_9SACH|nr:uncharacterized protein HG536_0B01630 [Torulaspora globosa]QLL31300.1 hypothetical protein HG536_0B01630 [Torulaspora globosa]